MLSFVVRFVSRLCLFVVVVGYFYSIINTDTRLRGTTQYCTEKVIQHFTGNLLTRQWTPNVKLLFPLNTCSQVKSKVSPSSKQTRNEQQVSRFL